jgi:glycosyltransferase involved in cell wall biosynthesis
MSNPHLDTISLTLIIPCYNEETNIQKGVLDKIGNFTKDNTHFSEVLIVDDGSTDNTKKFVHDKYLTRFPKFRLIENEHQGKAYAVITGIEQSKAPYVMFSDIDLATPIEESEELITEIQKGYDMVIGSRNTHREGAPLLRKLMAVGFIFIRNFFIGLRGIKDTQCGFKMFKQQAALDTIKHLRVFNNRKTVSGSSVSAGFDLEFLFVAKKLKYSIKEIPVQWRHVETKNVNFLNDSIETMKDIIRIKYYHLKSPHVERASS